MQYVTTNIDPIWAKGIITTQTHKGNFLPNPVSISLTCLTVLRMYWCQSAEEAEIFVGR